MASFIEQSCKSALVCAACRCFAPLHGCVTVPCIHTPHSVCVFMAGRHVGCSGIWTAAPRALFCVVYILIPLVFPLERVFLSHMVALINFSRAGLDVLLLFCLPNCLCFQDWGVCSPPFCTHPSFCMTFSGPLWALAGLLHFLSPILASPMVLSPALGKGLTHHCGLYHHGSAASRGLVRVGMGDE